MLITMNVVSIDVKLIFYCYFYLRFVIRSNFALYFDQNGVL